MLEFFRKYQRYFFMVIAVVIIISFSFFGTYNTIPSNAMREQVAFTAIDGTQIPRHEVDEMALFIGTDAEDKLLLGGMWGPNFLNDGVISKDFLQTGLGGLLVESYPDDVNRDLAVRLDREKRYVPYAHPQASFISLEGAWRYFAPEMNKQYNYLKRAQSPVEDRAFDARVGLFLGQKKFPSPVVRQVLKYQEKQYSWVAQDELLDREDLSLFGYHTLEDWFGPRFVRLVSEFIINASKIAEKKGYVVTKEEAWADLIRNSQMSFQQNISNPNLGVANGNEYFREQLRRLGMDQTRAVKVWRQVLLFRRMFHDLGNAMFVDPFSFGKLNTYAMETVEGEMYRLPEELRMGNYRALQKLEIYLNAVSNWPTEDKSQILMPDSYLTVKEISKKHPELVQKRYLLDLAQVDKKTLQGRVGVRESWNWEVEDQNWDRLKKEFPEIGAKKADTRDERFAVLDGLDDKTRARVDAFARESIVDSHPEWLEKALQDAPSKRTVIALHDKGGNTPIAGLENRKVFMKLLDERSPKLAKYSADDKHYYKIVVIDQSPSREVLTFAEADKEGILDKMLDKQLEEYYLKVRDTHAKDFQRQDKSWKPYEEVKNLVADRYFAQILKSIQDDYTKAIAPEPAPRQMIPDFTASLRFYAYARAAAAQIQKNPQLAEKWAAQPKEQTVTDKLAPREALDAQWKLVHSTKKIARGGEDDLANKGEILSLGENQWTSVQTSPNGDLYFFEVKSRGAGPDSKKVIAQVDTARELLSNDVQQRLMVSLLKEMKAKNSLSVDYLNQTVEMSEPDTNAVYGDF